jgi:hypothetical protein
MGAALSPPVEPVIPPVLKLPSPALRAPEVGIAVPFGLLGAMGEPEAPGVVVSIGDASDDASDDELSATIVWARTERERKAMDKMAKVAHLRLGDSISPPNLFRVCIIVVPAYGQP